MKYDIISVINQKRIKFWTSLCTFKFIWELLNRLLEHFEIMQKFVFFQFLKKKKIEIKWRNFGGEILVVLDIYHVFLLSKLVNTHRNHINTRKKKWKKSQTFTLYVKTTPPNQSFQNFQKNYSNFKRVFRPFISILWYSKPPKWKLQTFLHNHRYFYFFRST